MEDIHDTLLVNINLSSTESEVEIVTYFGQHRAIVNTFKGKDAELFYNTILSKKLSSDNLQYLSETGVNEIVLDDDTNDLNNAILEVEEDEPDIIYETHNVYYDASGEISYIDTQPTNEKGEEYGGEN